MDRSEELLDALTRMPPIPRLVESVGEGLGLLEGERPVVLGYHLVVGYETAAVYIITGEILVLFEASADGRSFLLTVDKRRIRRVARVEDENYTRLIVEIDADRSSTTAVMDENGASSGSLIPAGYELLEQDPEGRASLRTFGRAVARSLRL